MSLLVTGGAGYIGSHTCIELLLAGHEVVVFDNFSNSSPEALKRVERITGRKLPLVVGDIRDQAAIETALSQYQCQAVIHFAGLETVGESVEKPLSYYDNNVVGTHRLLSAMQNCGAGPLVFSSSATVYGEPQRTPLTENHPLSATNPYGRSKLIIENMLRDVHRANPSWQIALLRYFNPVGAHESGLLCGSHNGGATFGLEGRARSGRHVQRPLALAKTKFPRVHMNPHTARSIPPMQRGCSFISNQSLLCGRNRRSGNIVPMVSTKDPQGKTLRDAEVTN